MAISRGIDDRCEEKNEKARKNGKSPEASERRREEVSFQIESDLKGEEGSYFYSRAELIK